MRQGDQVLTDHNMRKKKNKTHHKAYRWQVRIVQKIDLRGVFETSLLMIYSFNFFLKELHDASCKTCLFMPMQHDDAMVQDDDGMFHVQMKWCI